MTPSPSHHHPTLQACTSPVTYSGLPDGAYQFAVRGRGESLAATQNFVKVTSPPSLAWNGTTLTASSTPDPTARFEFAGTAALPGVGVNYTCSLSVASPDPLQPPVYEGDVAPAPVSAWGKH